MNLGCKNEILPSETNCQNDHPTPYLHPNNTLNTPYMHPNCSLNNQLDSININTFDVSLHPNLEKSEKNKSEKIAKPENDKNIHQEIGVMFSKLGYIDHSERLEVVQGLFADSPIQSITELGDTQLKILLEKLRFSVNTHFADGENEYVNQRKK